MSDNTRKYGLILKSDKGWALGQIFAPNKHEAHKNSAKAGYPVWMAFDVETELSQFFCCKSMLGEITGKLDIAPDFPVLIAAIPGESK